MNAVYYTGWKLARSLFWICGGKWQGVEHIPSSGSFILASNHISYFDPPLVGCWIKRELAFFAKKELFEVWWLAPAIRRCNSIPVRRGAIDRDALRNSVERLQSGMPLALFPEGTRSRTGELQAPKPGIGMLARKAESAIVPAYISGSNRLGKCFRRQERLTITYGEPISSAWVSTQEDSKNGYLAIARETIDRIRQLRDFLPQTGEHRSA